MGSAQRLQIPDFRLDPAHSAWLRWQRKSEIKNLQSAIYTSFARAFSSISLAISAAVRGISGITHFTLPALISSCAIRQGLREGVSMTGGAPPCNFRARRAATRMYR